MAETKYTAGPWPTPVEYDEPSDREDFWDHGYDIPGICDIPFVGPRAKADADLIAAAPELLAALEMAWPALRKCGYRDDSREIKAIEAAISKATGGAQ